jgi:uncharacterized protein (DUF885 family)
MRIPTPLCVALVTVLLAGCSSSTEAPPAAVESFDDWANGFADDWVRASPTMATRSQYFAAAEQDALDRQLNLIGEWDYAFGAKAFADRAALARRGAEALDRLEAGTLTPEQRVSAGVIRWSIDDALSGAEFAQHRYVFDQFNGLQLEFINHLTQTMAIRSDADVDKYLARLALVAPRLDEGITEAKAAAANGIVPPRVVLERTLGQLQGFLALAANENVYVTTLATRLDRAMPPIAGAERNAALSAAEKTVAESVIPAYRRVRDFLTEQQTVAGDDVGVWRLPRGDAYYARQLATYTNTRMTADEIHNLGLREVARLEGEMDTILRQLGYTSGTVNERYAQLEKAIQPKGSADPRPQILADYTKWTRDAEARAKAIFDVVPMAPVDIRREPPFSEKTAAAHYTDPAPDGSRPGVFWVPLPGPEFGLLRMRSLTYHEAVPGHHFQLALQLENAALPKYRQRGIFGQTSANLEGWALYAERLADENGWYEGDPHGRLGYLNSMLFRARRLVVDTGIHAKRWTRQQAIDYGINAQEVERYIAWPGQATSYMVGQLRIVELREQARTALGPRFSVKDFHNVVLQSGSVPLEVLTQQVDAWVAAQQQ